jgi:serine/threonine protein kinase
VIHVVCSTCRSSLSPDASFCPHCGPDSGALFISEKSRVPTGAETETVRRLKAALGPQFEVIRLFGRGGFAEVYEVRDTELERRLAVKVLRSDMVWTPGMLQRFKQEARSVAQLTHPNTVPIHFVGEGQGLVFYVMPFIEGVTLADVMRAEGALDPERAITVALPVLEALDHAHRAGIVHRDIKPDNILIEAGSGRPLLVDFGISKRVNETTPTAESHEGVIFGTPIYMSPEQALGQHDVDARTDIYAMGALLYHMIVGAPPFTGETAHDIVAQHLTEPVRIPPDKAAQIPSWLSDVILRAMAKQPEERFQSAASMLEPLRQGARRKRAAGLITASRVLSRVNRDDPTIQLDAAPEQRRITERRFILTGALAIGALGAAAALVGRPAPEFVVENAFTEPVRISVNGDSQRTLRPGDSLRMELRRGAPLSAAWQVVGPRSASGDQLGESLGGTIRDDEPEGHIRKRLDLAAAGPGYIVPRVTNTTDESLRVFLHDSAGERRCDCDVPPGATDVPLGYLRPARTQAVSLVGAGGGRVTYDSDSLAARASAATGIVSLRVSRADLALPIASSSRRRPEPRPADPSSDLPDLMISVPAPVPQDSSPFVPDSIIPRADSTTAPKKDDPLGPIFQNR